MWITLRPAASSARAASITSITMNGSTSPRRDVRIGLPPSSFTGVPSPVIDEVKDSRATPGW
jgi:hypothetical protein